MNPESPNQPTRGFRLDVSELYQRLCSGDRVALGRAITLMESRRPGDLKAKESLIDLCSRVPADTVRIGISGLPGAGKSTFIERLGIHLTDNGHRVAVLAVDPSSDRSGGSILGDKTRMELLSARVSAFIRPSPNSGILGGVTEMTRETILLCEAAGYDIILIETVGVGQAEFGVQSMVDYFLVLTIPGAGDVLQGIKRGIMEMADGFVVNKADGDRKIKADEAAADLRSALRLGSASAREAGSPVFTASAATGEGIPEIWQRIAHLLEGRKKDGTFDERRKQQQSDWFDDAVDYLLRSRMASNEVLSQLRSSLETDVMEGSRHPLAAAMTFVDALTGSDSEAPKR